MSTRLRGPPSPSDRRRELEMTRELRRFHSENQHLASPLATQLTKKRLRVPRVDVDNNPFCMERQLADEYERLNFNKNPQFYSIALERPRLGGENPRNYSSFINQTADLQASSGLSPRIRAEFSAKRAAPEYEPPVSQFSPPSVVSVDSSNLRLPSGAPSDGSTTASGPTLPAAHQQYGVQLTSKAVTFGHRPGSGGRMYDRLTDSVSGSGGKSGVSTPARTGMSVVALAQLLAPAKAAAASTTTTRSEPATLSSAFDDDPDDEDEREGESSAAHRRRQRDKQRQQQHTELERNYQNAVFNPPRERKPMSWHAPIDQTTAQLIDKYRKLAVGKLPGDCE